MIFTELTICINIVSCFLFNNVGRIAAAANTQGNATALLANCCPINHAPAPGPELLLQPRVVRLEPRGLTTERYWTYGAIEKRVKASGKPMAPALSFRLVVFNSIIGCAGMAEREFLGEAVFVHASAPHIVHPSRC